MGSGPWRSFQRNGARSTAFKLDARAKLNLFDLDLSPEAPESESYDNGTVRTVSV